MDWQPATAIPAIPKGTAKDFIVCTRNNGSGKTYVYSACYLNEFPIHMEDGCDHGDESHDDDGCPFTGWHSRIETPEWDEYYRPIHREVTLLGWQEFPTWEEPK